MSFYIHAAIFWILYKLLNKDLIVDIVHFNEAFILPHEMWVALRRDGSTPGCSH